MIGDIQHPFGEIPTTPFIGESSNPFGVIPFPGVSYGVILNPGIGESNNP